MELAILVINILSLILLIATIVLLIFKRMSDNQVSEMDGIGEQLSDFSVSMSKQLRDEIDRFREERANADLRNREADEINFEKLAEAVNKRVLALSEQQTSHQQNFNKQFLQLTEANEKRMHELRKLIDERLQQINNENKQKLDEMRKVVDEKLQESLNKRFNESFKQVSERLEEVHKGLGEMQQLASGVGDLKKVLTNVKTRGTWGEIQLGALLEQMLSPSQYETNVAIRPRSSERVEFAIRLPGSDAGQEEIWLPIDAKFPIEDYQRLIDAQEKSDLQAIERESKQLENSIKASARDIRNKYIHPPHSTNFGIMYLPIEGLYAEVIKRPGLAELIQRECRVTIAGPTTLAALLNSLQMGFRTLAIQKRSGEMGDLLAAVKKQFGMFGDVLEKVHKNLQQSTSQIEKASFRSKQIEKRLNKVHDMPLDSAREILPGLEMAEDEEDEE